MRAGGCCSSAAACRAVASRASARTRTHFLRTASWTKITLLFAGGYLFANLLFALVLYLGGANVTNAHGFVDMYWFSIQTMATIGYGVLSPNDTLSNIVVTIESFVGIVLTALVTGVFFARFSTPSARVIFSKVAIIGNYDGKQMLMFRMANARATAIVEANIRVYVTRDEIVDGERARRIYDLPLRRATSPIFNLSWTAYHVIDDASPLHEVVADHMRTNGMMIIVTFQGTDDRLAATVHTRYAYSADDLVFHRRFVDIFKQDADGKRYLDFEPFHDTEPKLPAPAKAMEIAAPPSETNEASESEDLAVAE